MAVYASDNELVNQAKAGDHAALTEIYERYSCKIYTYIYARLHNRELAEDIHADVFVRMLEGINRYEDRGWSISAWLYRIAHDRTVDALRRLRHAAQLSLDVCEEGDEGIDNLVEARLDAQEVLIGLLELTDEQRVVVSMRFFEGRPIHEVAQAIGRTPGAVKALQYRATQALLKRPHFAAYNS